MLSIIFVFKLLYAFNVFAIDSDEWKLIFKAATGGNGSVYELFTGADILNVDNVHAQSISQPIKEHFKSDMVNQWSELSISEVLVRIHNNGEEVAYFMFDGVGSNKTNWFSLSRLKQSSYADLYNSTTNASINFFSIIGLQWPPHVFRTFYINSIWEGCPNDTGWLTILDVNSTWGCPTWEDIHLTEIPAILYSPLQIMANYEKEATALLAESMTVSVRFDRSNMTCVRMCSTPVQQDASSYCYKPCDSHSDIHKTFDSQSDINSIDLEQKVKQLKKKLTVDRKNTSMYKRSLRSVYENRTSAKTIGIMGAAIIASVIGLFVFFDCLRWKQDNKQ
ncbi:Hypothetical predicted protein [Mytilus galloprovincialis]|uniref:Farnesoic acid O-methyl transferase domain-containing protein n=1 Tax=Mytilus galloprovincialis TaxID=29158 RepID=A0A8B6H782_MYTGA|nr:Hypothetical predicted protein [Mytilus galloprovincialis]